MLFILIITKTTFRAYHCITHSIQYDIVYLCVSICGMKEIFFLGKKGCFLFVIPIDNTLPGCGDFQLDQK